MRFIPLGGGVYRVPLPVSPITGRYLTGKAAEEHWKRREEREKSEDDK